MPETQPHEMPWIQDPNDGTDADLQEAMKMLEDPKFATAAAAVNELPTSFAPDTEKTPTKAAPENYLEELDPDYLVDDEEDETPPLDLPREQGQNQSQVA